MTPSHIPFNFLNFLSFLFSLTPFFVKFHVHVHVPMVILIMLAWILPKISCMSLDGEIPWCKPMSNQVNGLFFKFWWNITTCILSFPFEMTFWTYQTHAHSSNHNACDELHMWMLDDSKIITKNILNISINDLYTNRKISKTYFLSKYEFS